MVLTDLEGFTAFTATKRDEAASLLLADHDRTAGPVVRSRAGNVVKRISDGLLPTFPQAGGRGPRSPRLGRRAPQSFRMPDGVHTGDVDVTRDDVICPVVNVAARVARTAGGDEVIATVAVQLAVATSLPWVQSGRAKRPKRPKLPGIPEPARIDRRLRALRDDASHFGIATMMGASGRMNIRGS